MMVVTSAVLFKQTKFSSDILITNMAYEVALTIKDAAVAGLSSRASSTILFKNGYGVHFEPAPGGGSPSSFIEFFDVSPDVGLTQPVEDDQNGLDHFYSVLDVASRDKVDKVISLTQGQTIKQYCAKRASNLWNCGPSAGYVLNIVYVRPNPDAHITMGTIGSGWDRETYSEAKIVVQSGLGDKCRTVSVTISGQVSVDPIDPNDLDGCDDISTGQ
jgi:hypothetical protein